MSPARRKAIGLITAAYVLALAAASLLPSGTGPLRGWDTALAPSLQNALHVPAYAVLLLLAAASLARPTGLSNIAIAVIACGCFTYGAALEFAQAAIPGRFGSLTDILLNAVGVAAGAGGAVARQMLLRSQRPPGPAGPRGAQQPGAG